MNLINLSTKELIDHVIKFDADPVRIKLARAFDSDSYLEDLEQAGMREDGTFDSEWGHSLTPGEYIRHLEQEIDLRDDELRQLRDELDDLKARTVADLIAELNQEITSQKYLAEEARKAKYKAEKEAEDAKEKLKMWNHLRTP